MAYRQRTLGRLGTAPPPTMKAETRVASVGGINSRDSVMQMPPEDCIYCHNLMPAEYGMRLRKGYREWANGLPSKANTILPYEGQVADASEDRLWAVTKEGIFNVSLFNTTAPVQEVVFGITTTEHAGYGVWTEFTNDAASRFLQYADGEHGLHEYSEDTGLWTIPSITGPTVANIAFVFNWKNRLWYIENDSGDAWYLAPDSNSGNATKFTFGSKFTHGGELKALYSWTVDGGDGIDDLLIAVSRGGDVLVYKGSDPSNAEFGLVGSFYIGEVPESRRLGVPYGGELFLISVYGIISIRDLLQGVLPSDTQKSPSAKVNRFLRNMVQSGKNDVGWALNIFPADGFMQVVVPYSQVKDATQFNYNLVTRAWGMWEGVPVNSAATWNEFYYIGDSETSVWIYDGEVDGLELAVDGSPGVPIEFDVLTSFQAPSGDHSNFKRVGFIRTIGFIAGTAGLNVKAVYDYAFEEVLVAPVQPSSPGNNVWDTALWDVDLWDFTAQGASFPQGALGIGRTVAIGMRGSASTRINIIGWDITWTQGGFL